MPTFVGGKKIESRTVVISNMQAFSGHVQYLPIFSVLKEEFKKGVMVRKISILEVESTENEYVFALQGRSFGVVSMDNAPVGEIDLADAGVLVLPEQVISVFMPVVDVSWVNITILFSEI